MLIITNDREKWKAEEAAGHTVAWHLSLNTGASWILEKFPDRGYRHHRELTGTSKGSCLILGHGPSRKLFKSWTRSMPVFAINRAVETCPDAEYWCAHEVDVIKSHAERRPRGSTLITQASNAIFSGFQDATQGMTIYAIDAEVDPTRWPLEKRPLYWNETTFGWVLHLVVRMGFEKIYTLGVDLSLGGYTHPAFDDKELKRQHYGVRVRTLEMFTPTEQKLWRERPVEILDMSGGDLPVPKVSVA